MDEYRAGLHVVHILQDRQQVIEVMAIDRPDIIEAQFFEQGTAGPEPA